MVRFKIWHDVSVKVSFEWFDKERFSCNSSLSSILHRFLKCPSFHAPSAVAYIPCRNAWRSTWRHTAQRNLTCVTRYVARCVNFVKLVLMNKQIAVSTDKKNVCTIYIISQWFCEMQSWIFAMFTIIKMCLLFSVGNPSRSATPSKCIFSRTYRTVATARKWDVRMSS